MRIQSELEQELTLALASSGDVRGEAHCAYIARGSGGAGGSLRRAS